MPVRDTAFLPMSGDCPQTCPGTVTRHCPKGTSSGLLLDGSAKIVCQKAHVGLSAAPCPLASAHGQDAAIGASLVRRLPRHDAGRRTAEHRARRLRPRLLDAARADDHPPLPVGLLRLHPARQPLPPDRRDVPRATLERDAAPQRALRAGVQRAPRPGRAPLRRPLPRLGHPRRRAPRGRDGLRPRQRRTGGTLRLRRALGLERRERPTSRHGPARAPAPRSRAARRPRSGRSTAGSRERAPPASSCGSASCPRR